MQSVVFTFFASVLGSVLFRALSFLGFQLVSLAAVGYFAQILVGHLNQVGSGLPSSALNLICLFGLDIAINYVISALIGTLGMSGILAGGTYLRQMGTVGSNPVP
jgi:hypothetical protein